MAGQGVVPADELGVVPDEVEGGDFSDMAAEDVHWLGREILWVCEPTGITLNNTHRLADRSKENVAVIEAFASSHGLSQNCRSSFQERGLSPLLPGIIVASFKRLVLVHELRHSGAYSTAIAVPYANTVNSPSTPSGNCFVATAVASNLNAMMACPPSRLHSSHNS
jgi:hypothetical protein